MGDRRGRRPVALIGMLGLSVSCVAYVFPASTTSRTCTYVNLQDGVQQRHNCVYVDPRVCRPDEQFNPSRHGYHDWGCQHLFGVEDPELFEVAVGSHWRGDWTAAAGGARASCGRGWEFLDEVSDPEQPDGVCQLDVCHLFGERGILEGGELDAVRGGV